MIPLHLVVLRAVEAMGGLDAMLRITKMRTRAWVEASEHVVGASVLSKDPYLYPLETWHAAGLDSLTKRSIPVELSLDPEHPNKDYQLYNPATTLGNYRSLVTYLWERTKLPPETIEFRRQGQRARWHFLDQFLDESIVLDYLDTEFFRRDQLIVGNADVILVRDLKYGGYFEAFFSVESGLLMATVEGLTPAEQE